MQQGSSQLKQSSLFAADLPSFRPQEFHLHSHFPSLSIQVFRPTSTGNFSLSPLPASFSLCKGQWENLFTSYPCLQHSLPLPHTAPHPRLIFSKTGCHTYGPHFRSEVSDTVKYHRSGKPPCSSHPGPPQGWCRPGEAGRAALG